MDCTKEACNKLASALKGNAILNGDAMRAFFVEKHYNASKINASDDAQTHYQTYKSASLQLPPMKQIANPIKLCDSNSEALIKYNQTLTLKAYSPNTIRTYMGEFSVFLQTLGTTTAESLATIVVSG